MNINEIKGMKIKEDVCGIYSISNLDNGNMYVGSSIHVYSRWKEHVRMLEKGNHHQVNLRKEFLESKNKDIYDFKILEIFDDIKRRELNRIEDKYILEIREVQEGYLQKTNREIYIERGYLREETRVSSVEKYFKNLFYGATNNEKGLTTKKCAAMIKFFKKGKHKDDYFKMKLMHNNQEFKINNVAVTLGMLEFIVEEVKLEGLIITGDKIITQYYKTSYNNEIRIEVIDNVFNRGVDFSNCIAVMTSTGTYQVANVIDN